MPKFGVTVKTRLVLSRSVEVEASDAEEAEQIVRDKAEEPEFWPEVPNFFLWPDVEFDDIGDEWYVVPLTEEEVER